MANKTIGDLTPATTPLNGTELLHVVQGANSRKVTGLDLLKPSLSAADQASVRASFSAPLKGHLYGLTLSNNAADATNDIDIASGEAASEQVSPLLMAYAGASGVQLDVAYGAGNGGRFDSAISDGTWHVFLISNGTTVSRGLSKSLDPTGQANYPSGYTHYRRIGSIIRGASAILAFTQTGKYFHLLSGVTDLTSAAAAANALLALSVPNGLVVLPMLEIRHISNVSSTTSVSVGSGNAAAAQMTLMSYSGASAFVSVANPFGVIITNTSRQIRYSIGIEAGTVLSSTWKTWGWMDVGL